MAGYSGIMTCEESLVYDMLQETSEMRGHALRKGRFRSGFTLIELLVVIAVISMLMSMMMPGLKGAKEAGKQVACLSNIRQLTVGWSSYNADNGERLCAPHTQEDEDKGLPVGDSRWADYRWVTMEKYPPSYQDEGVDFSIANGALYPYVNDPGPYKCGSDRIRRSRSFAVAHGMGAVIVQDGLDSVTRFTRISNTSKKIVFADAEAGCNEFMVTKSFCPVSVDDNRWTKMGDRSFISARHKQGSNFTFADGHAEHWEWKDTRTVGIALAGDVDVNAAADASVGNEDFERMLRSLLVD